MQRRDPAQLGRLSESGVPKRAKKKSATSKGCAKRLVDSGRFFASRDLASVRRMFWFQRKLVGTFQLTVLRDVDTVIPILFYSGAALGVGAVRDRVIAVDGQPQVRKTGPYCRWHLITQNARRETDGRLALAGLSILEGDELLYEADEMPHIAETAAETPLLVAKPSTTRRHMLADDIAGLV